jgi:hypothetical protein
MHRILAIAGLSLALTTLPAAAQMITISPQQIGQIFCIARLGNDMASVQGLLTEALSQAIADAEKKDDDWAKANPGDKPPLGDGIPWQAWPDYAPQCAVGNVVPATDKATVEIGYTFPESPDANFTDTLHLLAVADPSIGEPVWRIDNLEYATGGDLQSTLIEAFAN